MDEIIGKIIAAIYMGDDGHFIVFEDTSNNYYLYESKGECCSTSWIEHIENPEFAIGQQVLSYDKYEKGSTEDNCTKFWMYTVKTEKGEMTIDFRNESNGYYGGRLKYRKLEPEQWERYWYTIIPVGPSNPFGMVCLGKNNFFRAPIQGTVMEFTKTEPVPLVKITESW